MEVLRESAGPSRPSHDSTTGASVSPSIISSNFSDELLRRFSIDSMSSKPATSVNGDHCIGKQYDITSRDVPDHGPQVHTITLSSIEHCMPRAYIRVCLAYRLSHDTNMEELVDRLNQFARKVVDAKPYLAGHVVPAPTSKAQPGLAEICFTDHDFLHFPPVELQYISGKDIPFTYNELDRMGLPPSLIRPEIVSALPEGTNDGYAPVFRLQANVVQGGLIVSAYLHHCISDGTGMGLIITGSVLHDDFTFDRHLESRGFDTCGLNRRLSEFANQQSIVRQQLSWSYPNQIRNRHFHPQRPTSIGPNSLSKPNGRGCIFVFAKDKLRELREQLGSFAEKDHFITPNDVLQALLWHRMTKARSASLSVTDETHSRLFTPVNIRSKIRPPLSDSYFGAAVDFAVTELSIEHLTRDGHQGLGAMTQTALAIRQSIQQVNEPYIRQAIALARDPDPNVDVRDLMGSSMNRSSGADMYITSWERLGLYEATLDLGLGRPDWVRKPWSRDPGSCIILPNDDRKQTTEVLVQMTMDDMERLMQDTLFKEYAYTWIE